MIKNLYCAGVNNRLTPWGGGVVNNKPYRPVMAGAERGEPLATGVGCTLIRILVS